MKMRQVAGVVRHVTIGGITYDVSSGRQAVITPWGVVTIDRGAVMLPWGNHCVPMPMGLLERLEAILASDEDLIPEEQESARPESFLDADDGPDWDFDMPLHRVHSMVDPNPEVELPGSYRALKQYCAKRWPGRAHWGTMAHDRMREMALEFIRLDAGGKPEGA